MKRLTLDNFTEEVLESLEPTMVLFKSETCYLCAGLGVVMPRIERRFKDKVNFAYVDVVDEEGLSDIFSIEGVPTIYFFNNGRSEEVEYPRNPDLFSGYSEDYIISFLREAVGSE